MSDLDMENTDATYITPITVGPKFPHYAGCSERLNTFNSWPLFHHPEAQELAQGGFYYTGFGDRVQCFYCGLLLKDWTKTDVVVDEHFRHNPKCYFINMCYCKKKCHSFIF